jgi:DNA mismatch repair ATPase MutS
MDFESILFVGKPGATSEETLEQPEFFVDVNLDQVVNATTAGKQEEYNLKPHFYTSLQDIDAIRYRQEVMRDLDNDALLDRIKAFAQSMHRMRLHLTLSNKLDWKQNKQGWFLETVLTYCDAVIRLSQHLESQNLESRGFIAFREYLAVYSRSDRFASLCAEARRLVETLSSLRYCLIIAGSRVKVRRYESESDYSVEVERTFERFQQGAVKDYRFEYYTDVGMNHVQARIAELVARLYPDQFADLDQFCAENVAFLDRRIVDFDREVQFYVAYLDYIAPLKRAGLSFCYPEISAARKEIYECDGFDLALASILTAQKAPVVCNDFHLEGSERVFVVSGPNQGGKTTFARMFAQLHYLASLGFSVPGSRSRLFLFDRIFTHFEKEEEITNLRGKLQDDLVRVRQILERATPRSLIVMNEMFTSTTLRDAIFLGTTIMNRILGLDALCVWVTFVVELASLGEKTVSVVSTVAADNAAHRTFRILRQPADGLSYALSLADKYRLTRDQIRERAKQ